MTEKNVEIKVAASPATDPTLIVVRMTKGVVVPGFSDLKPGDVIRVSPNEGNCLIGMGAAVACGPGGEASAPAPTARRIRMLKQVVIPGLDYKVGNCVTVPNALANELCFYHQAEEAPTILQKLAAKVGIK